MLRFTIKTERPQNAGALRTLLEAHDAYERMRATRSYSVHVVVLVSVLVWFGACWPTLVSVQARTAVEQLWGVACFLLVVVGALEWIWHRRRLRYLMKMGKTPQGRRPGDDLKTAKRKR